MKWTSRAPRAQMRSTGAGSPPSHRSPGEKGGTAMSMTSGRTGAGIVLLHGGAGDRDNQEEPHGLDDLGANRRGARALECVAPSVLPPLDGGRADPRGTWAPLPPRTPPRPGGRP